MKQVILTISIALTVFLFCGCWKQRQRGCPSHPCCL